MRWEEDPNSEIVPRPQTRSTEMGFADSGALYTAHRSAVSTCLNLLESTSQRRPFLNCFILSGTCTCNKPVRKAMTVGFLYCTSLKDCFLRAILYARLSRLCSLAIKTLASAASLP